jgi:hypothetical protein
MLQGEFFRRGLPRPAPGDPDVVLHDDVMVTMTGPIVSVPMAGSRTLAYPTTFYPNAVTPNPAQALIVQPGETRSGVDFALAPVPTSRVSGVVRGDGGPLGGIALRLVALTTNPVAEIDVGMTESDTTGRFTFMHVPSGRYAIEVLELPRETSGFAVAYPTVANASGTLMVRTTNLIHEPTQWASVPLAVGDRDVDDVVVPLRSGIRISGRVEFTGKAAAPAAAALSRIRVTIERADGRALSPISFTESRTDSDSTFRTIGLAAGRYLVKATAPAPWSLASARWNGQDLSQRPVDLDGDISGVVVTFTDALAQVAGVVRRRDGTPDGAAVVSIFPYDRTAWVDFGATTARLRRVRADPQGRYSITGLPAGTYAAVATHASGPHDWMHGSLLERLLSEAIVVMLADGEARTTNLTTREIR